MPYFVRASHFVVEGGGVLVVVCFVVAGDAGVAEVTAAPMSPTVASGDGWGWRCCSGVTDCVGLSLNCCCEGGLTGGESGLAGS
jgi:hypothetical protein